MAKPRYQYNFQTCRYEPWQQESKAVRRNILTFLGLSFMLAGAGYLFYFFNFGSFDEILLDQKNHTLKAEWQILEERIAKSNKDLQALIEKDDHNYRIILDSSPLEPSIRNAGIGGREKLNITELNNSPILVESYTAIEKLKHQLDVEVQSYHELNKLLEEKAAMWASRPAIQPISNKQLDKLHMSYGARLHPIFHVYMDHKGLDFAADHGTPVYATGDGIVDMAYFSSSYGNVIYIDHGYHYETRYAHLSRFNVKAGEAVKRGQIIGYVGNTGNSVSSHLHYEVLHQGQHVNPINFFQRDLSNKEYEKLIEIGSRQNVALD